MRRPRAIFAALLLGALSCAGAPARAAFPDRPVQMVVPYPPGGNTDLMARALQQELSRALGQTVVVINRGGAAGTLGDAELARARPDGYTIGLSPNNPLTAQPHLQPLPYSIDSFRFLCLVYDNPQVVVLGRDAPFRDLDGLRAVVARGPEALVYGSPGQGSTQHILVARMLRAVGGGGLHVPFTGAGPMAQSALGGQIMAFVESASIPAATGLPVLGVMSRDRLAALPGAPTLRELGLPIEGTSAGGLIAPANIPEDAAAAIERACAAAVGSDGFRAAAERLSSVPAFLPGAAFRARFAAESAENRDVLRDLGIARE